MSVSHIINSANSDLQDIYVKSVDVSSGVGNCVLGLNAPSGSACAVNYSINDVLTGSVSCSSSQLIINGNLSDPTLDVAVQCAPNRKLTSNTAYSYDSGTVALVTGNSPVTANNRVARIQFTNITDTAAGAEKSVVWVSDQIVSGSIIRCTVLGTSAGANSGLVFVNSLVVGGQATLYFVNPGSSATGGSISLVALLEILN